MGTKDVGPPGRPAHRRASRLKHPRRAVRSDAARPADHHATADDSAYLVSCWRGKLRSCRAFATLAEARAVAAQHVEDAAAAFPHDGRTLPDGGFPAAASWALDLEPRPAETAARDLADGTRICVRLVSADTARCLR